MKLTQEESDAINHFVQINQLYKGTNLDLKYTESEYDNSTVLLNLINTLTEQFDILDHEVDRLEQIDTEKDALINKLTNNKSDIEFAQLELGNLMFNTNYNQMYSCPRYIVALLEYINRQLCRIMWNIDQEEYDSPFENTGNSFQLGNFEIQAYNWNDDEEQEYNFIYKVDKTKSNLDDIKISWYKYLGRDTTINQMVDENVIINIFEDIITQLLKFEDEEMKKKGL